MNYICNTCLGGWIYKKNKTAYNNPFIWNGIDVIPMLNLINHFEEIKNTNDIELDKDPTTKNQSFIIKLPYNVNIHYRHYRLDLTAKTNYVNGVDVFGSKIYEYTYNKFLERKERMNENNEEPTFIVVTRISDIYNYTLENTIDFIKNLHTKYKVIIITNYKELKKYETENVSVSCIKENVNVINAAELVKYI